MSMSYNDYLKDNPGASYENYLIANTYEAYTGIFDSKDFTDKLKYVTDKSSENPFKTAADFELNPESILSSFYEDTLKVGSNNTFETIATEFNTAINEKLTYMTDYVAEQEAAKAEIDAAIEQDNAARAAAKAAYDAIMANTAAYRSTETYYDAVLGCNSYRYVIDTERQKSDAQAAYNEVWKRERHWVWG